MAYVVPETFQPCTGARKELPPGLIELAKYPEIRVSRNVNLCEVFLCCMPRQASFSVTSCTDPEEEFLTIKESGLCVFRECLGAARNLVLRVNNVEDDSVATFYRNMTCSRGCCGSECCAPVMAVNSPPFIRLGTIQERVKCCSPKFDAVSNKDDKLMLTYSTNCCYLKTCNWFSDVEIEILDPTTDECVAKIIKKSKHDGAELFSLKNDFIIQYLTDLDIIRRVMVLGMCLLIDFNNFEHDRRFCC